jgi:hypothetical protein
MEIPMPHIDSDAVTQPLSRFQRRELTVSYQKLSFRLARRARELFEAETDVKAIRHELLRIERLLGVSHTLAERKSI